MPAYKLLPKQKEFFEIKHNNSLDVVIYQGGYTCVPADAEYLSPEGWKRIDTLTKQDMLAVYYDNGSIVYEHPKEVFKWEADYWYEFHTRTLHQKLCPNHKIVTWKNNKKYVQSMLEFYDEHNNSTNGHTGKFRTTFNIEGEKLPYTDDELRFIIAYQADGTKANKGCARFHLSKKRKLKRLLDLLDRLDYEYDINVYADEEIYINVYVNPDMMIKEFPNDWYQLGTETLRIIIDEVQYWDGTAGETHNSYYTSIKANADFIQFAGSACGYRTSIFSRVRPSAGNSGTMCTEHRVNFNNNITPSLVCSRTKAVITKTKSQSGEYKYCPSTSTGMWLMRYSNKIVVTGNSGKTWCGSLLGIMLARKYPGCKGLVGAKEYELVKNTTLESYFEHLDMMGYIKDRDYRYNKVDKKISLSNGSEILFKGLDDPEKFKSLNLHWVEIEEASQISDSSFKGLLGRLRGSIKREWGDNFTYRLFGHTNPQPNKGWIWKRFVENSKENYRLIIAPTSENTNLPPHFVESLKDEYDEEYYRINVLGEFGNYSSGLVVKHFSSDNEKKITYNNDLPLYLTCDFNVDPMCWCLAHKDEDNVYFFDELVIENTSTQACIEEFTRRYPNHRNKIIICGDASGDWRSSQSEFTNYMIIRRELESKGYQTEFKLRSFNPPILRRIQAFNARVRNANGECHIFIDDKCKWLKHNMYNLAFKEGTSIVDVPTVKQIKNDRESKFLEHPFDAASYLVEYFFPIK